MVSRNIIANSAARIWKVLINLAFVPLYIHYLGMEAYGLIGFFATLQSVFSLMDLGWSTNLSRELAIHHHEAKSRGMLRDLLHTTEVSYLVAGTLIGIIVYAGVPVITRFWIHPQRLSLQAVTSAIRLLALAITAQWPIKLYEAGLLGLERQQLNAVITSASSTSRAIGAVGVLALISPSINAFFIWQTVVSVATLLVLRTALWSKLSLPNARRKFRLSLLLATWQFAMGITTITALSLVFSIGDKIVISALLPLKTLGYYTLASQIGSAVAFLSLPIYYAVFPRFSSLLATGNHLHLTRLYHRSSQLMSVTILPLVVIVAFYAQPLVFAWTGSLEIAAHLRWMLPILALGSGLNALSHTPYALQLANGWTRLAVISDTTLVAVLGPLLILLTWRFGATGAALIWLLYNASNVFIVTPFMHRRLLVKEKWNWFLADVGHPLLAAVAVAIGAKYLLPYSMTRMEITLSIAFVGAVAGLAALAVTTELRTILWRRLNQIRTLAWLPEN